MQASDDLFLRIAVALAKRGQMTCAPNPPVGCVIVRDGQIIGRGYHRRAGEGHAEVEAIADAGGKVQGATVYVSLEPCAFVGRTPACATTLVEKQVARVVVAAQDPHPKVSGAGLRILREAGIAAELRTLYAAQDLIRGFAARIGTGRPLVRVKTASSIDGAVALANGESQWITGPAAREDVQYWRARSDAIITGVGTVIADDPRLNVRSYPNAHQPLRVVLDRQARVPPASRLLNDGQPTLVVHHPDATLSAWAENTGVSTLAQDPSDLAGVLAHLAHLGCNEVLVEAGPGIVGSVVQAGLWDEWVAYIAPKLLGSESRQVAEFKINAMANVVGARVIEQRLCGDDLRVLLRPAAKAAAG